MKYELWAHMCSLMVSLTVCLYDRLWRWAFWAWLCRTLRVWWGALWSDHWTVSLSIGKDRRTLRERYTQTSCANSHKPSFKPQPSSSLSQFVTAGFMVQAVLSCVSVHTEPSVTSARVTAHVLSPGWDPPVRKVRVCVGLLSYTLGIKLSPEGSKIWYSY